MPTIEGTVKNGRIVTRQPLKAANDTRCLVTILEEIATLRARAKARIAPREQAQLSALLAENRRRRLKPAEVKELDELLLEVHELMASRAEALWILKQLGKR